MAKQEERELTPIFVSVKEAAKMLGISAWSCYKLLDEQKVDSRYHGRRRLVRVESLNAYADSLPIYPDATAS